MLKSSERLLFSPGENFTELTSESPVPTVTAPEDMSALLPAVNTPSENIPPNDSTAPAPEYPARAADAPSASAPRLNDREPPFETVVAESCEASEPSAIEREAFCDMFTRVPAEAWAYSRNSAEPLFTLMFEKSATLRAPPKTYPPRISAFSETDTVETIFEKSEAFLSPTYAVPVGPA